MSAIVLLCSCGRGLPDRAKEQFKQLREAGELATTEYTITKVIKANDNADWWKIGDRKILFTCKAHLTAGVDMAAFDDSKVKVDRAAGSIEITLPPVKLLSINMPPNEVRLAYQKVSGLRFEFTADERNAILRQGESAIKAEIPSLGILDDARTNAESFFRVMLGRMGYNDINIKFESDE